MKRQLLTLMIAAALLVFTRMESAQAINDQQTSLLSITKTVSLKEAFDIRLESNASTGYSWAIDSGEGLARLKIIGDSYDAPGSVIGSPGTQIFHFVAVAPGQSRIVFTYSRAWEPNEPAQSAEAIITIE